MAQPGVATQVKKTWDPEEFNTQWTEALQFMLEAVRDIGYVKEGHPFFFVTLSQLRRVLDADFKAPAAVGFTPDSPQGKLWVNPSDFNQDHLNILERAGLLVHEVMHIVFDHLHYPQAQSDPKMWNIAADCAINQLVVKMGYKLPEFKVVDPVTGKEHTFRGITPQSLGEMFQCAPPDEGKDGLTYFDWILRKVAEQNKDEPKCNGSSHKCGSGGNQQGQQPGSGSHQHDPNGSPCSCPKHDSAGGNGSSRADALSDATNHEWNDLSPEEREIIRKYEANLVKAAKEAADGMHEGGSGIGDIAGGIANKLKALEPKVDWSQELRRFAGGIGKVAPRIRRSRINKYGFPGKHSYFPDKAIAIITDESGSVSDKESQQFLAECDQVDKSGVKVFRVLCDAQVNGFGWIDEDPTLLEDRVGYGGTTMKAGLDFILDKIDNKELNIGGVVVLTDGELPSCDFLEVGSYPVPILYIFTRKSSQPPKSSYHGETIWFEKSVDPWSKS